jgi:hypothetical protein
MSNSSAALENLDKDTDINRTWNIKASATESLSKLKDENVQNHNFTCCFVWV